MMWKDDEIMPQFYRKGTLKPLWFLTATCSFNKIWNKSWWCRRVWRFFGCKSLDSWETTQDQRTLFFLRNSFLLWCEVLFNVIVLLWLTSAPNFVIWFLGTHFTLLLTEQVTAWCCWQVLNFKPQNGCPPVSKAKFSHPNLAKLKAFSTQGSLLFVWWLCKWTICHMMFFANNVCGNTKYEHYMGHKTHAVKGWTEWGQFDTHQENGLTRWDIWFTSSEWMGRMEKLGYTSSGLEWTGWHISHNIHSIQLNTSISKEVASDEKTQPSQDIIWFYKLSLEQEYLERSQIPKNILNWGVTIYREEMGVCLPGTCQLGEL